METEFLRVLQNDVIRLEREIRALKSKFTLSPARRVVSSTSTGVSLHGLLSAGHPDTNPSGPTDGALIYGNDDVWDKLLIGSEGYVLKVSGGVPVWSEEAASPIGEEFTGTTTDATPSTLGTIEVPASTTVHLLVDVVARRTGGSAGTSEDGASYRFAGTFKNVSGTATIIGSLTILHTAEDQPAWNATLTLDMGNVEIEVTGAVDNNISWTARAVTLEVSSH